MKLCIIMSIKKWSNLFLLCTVVFLFWCSSGDWWPVSWLPELFSIAPDGYDQLLHITVDEWVLSILTQQYGDGTPVVEEFQKIDELLIRQKDSETAGETLLLVKWDQVDLQQLAVLWLVGWDESYASTSLTENIQVYWQKDQISSIQFDGLTSNDLMRQTWSVISDESNFVFVSRPTTLQLPWLAWQFSQQLKGTTWAFKIWTEMPSWQATMLFSSWVVPKFGGTWQARSWSEWSPVHIATHDLFELLSIPKTLLETFLPVFAQQYVWESLSLLNPDDYSTIFESLWGELSLDLIPSVLGMGWRLTIENEKLYDVLYKMQPALDGYFKAELFSDADVESSVSEREIMWSSDIPLWDGTTNTFPLVWAKKDSTNGVTQVEFMALDDSPSWVNNVRKEYPWATFLVADIDFALLSSLLWTEMQMLAWPSENTLHVEMTSEPKNDLVRIVVN